MTSTEALIERSEEAKVINRSPIFDIIDSTDSGLMTGAFGVHFLLRDSNYILIYDRFQKQEFIWYETLSRAKTTDCLFGLMDVGFKEIRFEQVFNNVSLYQQEHLLYMMNIFTETE
jgi:hypothetical protein